MARLIGGALGGEWSGRVGNAVLVRTAGGTVLRERPTVNDPQSPAQRAVREAQARAARAWSEMEPEAAARWAAYGKAAGMRPMNAFTTLYKVLLRLDPAAPAPLVPPARPFFGDVVAVSATGTSDGVAFAATGPNAAGVVTEVLLQPLASRNRRAYREKYRHAAFVGFTSGSLVVPVRGAGWVACGYRFVNAATGQVTEIAELGVVRVG